jgi:hypothetical protein
MVNVAASVGVSDALSGVKSFSLVNVTSNQPDSGLGAGDLPNDIQGFTFGTVDLAGQLRAEAYVGTRSYTLNTRRKTTPAIRPTARRRTTSRWVDGHSDQRESSPLCPRRGQAKTGLWCFRSAFTRLVRLSAR